MSLAPPPGDLSSLLDRLNINPGSPSMEIAAFDSRQGVVFYTRYAEKPGFTRLQVRFGFTEDLQNRPAIFR